MCGIYGLAWRKGVMPDGAAGARRMARAMQGAMHHRGPDGAGMIERDNVILGHLRLAIIDLDGGAQPMVAPDRPVSLSYNGECYNFLDLMGGLSARGWSFQSRCDSEVLLAGYCLDGETFDEALNGMYAYALLDERGDTPSIQVSTDPVGIKPLFLYEDDGLVMFASELRAIVAGLRVIGREPELSRAGLEAYLRHGWVPAPLSLIEGARKLAPGERWRIDLRGVAASHLSTRSRPGPVPAPEDEADLDRRLHAELREVVSRQTISDVPLGFFLSGGIDSSLLLAVASELGLATESYTIRFTGQGHGVAAANEAEIARAVAERLGSRISVVDVDGDTLRNSLDETLGAMDQPVADPACLPLLLLSRFARQQVKVCLSGDGGDELFAGYPRHGFLGPRRAWQRVPRGLRAIARAGAARLPGSPGIGVGESLRRLGIAHRLIDSPGYVDGPFAPWLQHEQPLEAWNRSPAPTSQAVLDADIDGQLAGQMLPKTDNMTMAVSLECRVPLLDLNLIALAEATPLAWKRRGRNGKLPLRRMLEHYLPPEITARPKRGFRVPLTSWFQGPLAEELRARLVDEGGVLDEILGPGVVRSVVEEHLSGRAEHSTRIWSLLAFARWQDRTIAGAPR